jgi:hypothetical protein
LTIILENLSEFQKLSPSAKKIVLQHQKLNSSTFKLS